MDLRWQVILRGAAEKEFKALPEDEKRDILSVLESMEDGDSPADAQELRRNANTFRAYFFHGHYRIIWKVYPRSRRIIVTRLRPRPTAYSGIEDDLPKKKKGDRDRAGAGDSD